jgi:hypothetical protein
LRGAERDLRGAHAFRSTIGGWRGAGEFGAPNSTFPDQLWRAHVERGAWRIEADGVTALGTRVYAADHRCMPA